MPLSIGQVLVGRYRVEALLGQGGFGAVYRVWDSNLNRPRALKENLDTSAEAHRQFEREAGILTDLTHPNLPHVVDYFFIADQGQYLVMDFVEGEDLQALLDRTNAPVPEAQAAAWISQVCEALSYLHQQNPPVVHRDVKPANIKITSSGKAVLVDFGIAKVFDATLRTTLGARAVTPGYSPPEQYGQGTTDPRSDIYAVGATLYALLTGQEPVESVARFSGQTLKPPRTLNPDISTRAEAVVLRAMKLDPIERYQSAHDLKAQLTGTPSSIETPRKRSKWVMIAIGVCLCLALGFLLAMVVLNSSSSSSSTNSTPTLTLPAPTNTPTPVPTATDTAQPTASREPTVTPMTAVPTATLTPTTTAVVCPKGQTWDAVVGRCRIVATRIRNTATPTAVACPPGQFWDPFLTRCRNDQRSPLAKP
jgi:eukaryotic-like serine/threonine-protein kinase